MMVLFTALLLPPFTFRISTTFHSTITVFFGAAVHLHSV